MMKITTYYNHYYYKHQLYNHYLYHHYHYFNILFNGLFFWSYSNLCRVPKVSEHKADNKGETTRRTSSAWSSRRLRLTCSAGELSSATRPAAVYTSHTHTCNIVKVQSLSMTTSDIYPQKDLMQVFFLRIMCHTAVNNTARTTCFLRGHF